MKPTRVLLAIMYLMLCVMALCVSSRPPEPRIPAHFPLDMMISEPEFSH